MELIIAMALAFILGAYIRAPFKLFKRKSGADDTEQAVGSKDEEQIKLERQLNNLLNYGRERD